MRYFLKLNIVCALYGLIFAIPLNLFLETYRILRITKMETSKLDSIASIVLMVTLFGGGIVCYNLQKNWLDIGNKKSNFWSTIFWFPYSILFLRIIGYLSPPMSPGDELNAASGFIIFGGLVSYPLYVLIMNFIVYLASDTIERN